MKRLRSQQGFTILEVLIALGLLTIVLASVLITQGNGMTSSTRTKNILIATNLARNFINESELKYEGLAFDKLPKKEDGNFAEPYAQFKWTITFDEVDFSALTEMIKKASEGESKTEGTDPNTEMLAKYFQDFMQKSVRRMQVTIEWPEGSATTKQTFTELLVNYDAEFAAGI